MKDLSQQFLLRKDITFLNYGSFGACAKPIFEKYQQYQLELEQEPVLFITGTGPKYLERSRKALGEYLNCQHDNLVYVTNPSYAVNIVAKSFPLKQGDEILTTDLEYGACDRTWNYYCNKAGAFYKRQPIRLPVYDKEEIIKQLFQGVTAKTKLVFISHLTSSTALRFPVEEITAKAKELGLLVFIDGAHAPAHVKVDLEKLNADFYTGACHKWMMTPKGSSFLYAKKEVQGMLDPLIVSWGYNALFPSSSQFLDYHQMQGTRDFSAFLTIPDAIEFMKENDWWSVATNCRKLLQENNSEFCKRLGSTPLAPVNEDFIGQIFSAEIRTKEPEKLHDHFFEKYKIQIPVMRHGDKVYLRYSIQAFNTQKDMDTLFDAIDDIKNNTSLIEK